MPAVEDLEHLLRDAVGQLLLRPPVDELLYDPGLARRCRACGLPCWSRPAMGGAAVTRSYAPSGCSGSLARHFRTALDPSDRLSR